jgi:PAS domain S-box-containing protein
LADVALRRALSAAVLRAVRPLSFGLAAFYGALAVLSFSGALPEVASARMLYPWAVSAVALTFLGVIVRRPGFPSDWAHGSFAVVMGIVLVDSGLLMRTGGPPSLSVVYILVLLGASIVVLSRTFFVLIVVAAFATWSLASWGQWPVDEWAMWLLVLIATSIIGFAAQISRERTFVRLERARHIAQRLAAIVEASHEAIISMGLDGTILTWNKGAQALYGYPMDEAVGRNAEFLFPPNYRAELGFFLDRLARGESAAIPETYRRTRNGELIPVAVSVAPIRDASGTVIGGSSIAIDLRPRKALDEEKSAMMRREAELRASQQVSRLKSEFINVAAHELYTPITPLKLRLHELRPLVHGEKGKEALATMERSVNRLQAVIEEIVHVAQVQGTQIVSKPTTTVVEDVVREVVDELRARADARRQTLVLAADGRNAIQADIHRLRDAFLNLADNALKFTPEGGTISFRVERRGDNEVIVSVQDSGPGMRPEQIGKLFKDPIIAEDYDRRTEPGWGFGLFVSRRIVEAHGGTIWVESDGPGNGSTFFVSLPMARVAQPSQT